MTIGYPYREWAEIGFVLIPKIKDLELMCESQDSRGRALIRLREKYKRILSSPWSKERFLKTNHTKIGT